MGRDYLINLQGDLKVNANLDDMIKLPFIKDKAIGMINHENQFIKGLLKNSIDSAKTCLEVQRVIDYVQGKTGEFPLYILPEKK